MTISALKIIYLIGLFVGPLIRLRYGLRNKNASSGQGTRQDRVLARLAGMGFLFGFVYVFSSWLSFADYKLPGWIGWLGTLIYVAAFWLLWRAHADLGKNFSPILTIKAEQELVTEGVFKNIRHPIYAAFWLLGLAQVLLLPNWVAGPAMLVFMCPLYFIRVPKEEAMLMDEFGGEYHEYMEKTGRVFPRLWD